MVGMDLKDSMMYGIRNISSRKLRSALTLVGIIIGIITIVCVMSIGEGLKKEVTKELETFGSDRMFIIPVNIEKKMASGSFGGTTNGKLFEKDVDKISKIPGLQSIDKMVYGRAGLEFKDKKISALVYANGAGLFEQWSDMYKLETGRYFKDSEVKVAVLGNSAANELFGKNKIAVGNYLMINGEKYRVVGILQKIGTALSQSDDESIFVPFDDGKKLFANQLSKNEISFISIKLEPGYDAEEIKEVMEAELASLHRVSVEDKDFTVMTAELINETVGAILGLVTAFLFMITLISAIVGGVGIANTMFTSVIERTKEIGILKAVGATKNDILLIFVVESGLIGFVGGAIGVILGVIILVIANQFGVPVLIKPELVIFALSFAGIVGLVSGVFPAKQAAELNAVEALGFE